MFIKMYSILSYGFDTMDAKQQKTMDSTEVKK